MLPAKPGHANSASSIKKITHANSEPQNFSSILAMEALKMFQCFILWFMCSTVLFLNALQPCFAFTSFVFGDSLVDAGNNDYIFTLSKADSPYGIDFKPSGGRPPVDSQMVEPFQTL